MHCNDDQQTDNWVEHFLIKLLGLAAISAETHLITASVRIDLNLQHSDRSLTLAVSVNLRYRLYCVLKEPYTHRFFTQCTGLCAQAPPTFSTRLFFLIKKFNFSSFSYLWKLWVRHKPRYLFWWLITYVKTLLVTTIHYPASFVEYLEHWFV